MICPACLKAGALLAENQAQARYQHLYCIGYKTSKTYCDCQHWTEGSALNRELVPEADAA